MTEKPAVDAVQFAADLVQKHGVTTGSPGATAANLANTDGKVAMWRANRGAFGGLANVTSFKFNVVPLARASQGGASVTVTTPGHISIAKSNKHPDAAWEWHKFLTG